MGHEVVPFSRDVTRHFTEYKEYQTSPREREKFLEYKSFLQRELLREITAEHRREEIDLFFSYFWSEICDPDTVEAIRALGITTVNWYCNGSDQFCLVADTAAHHDWKPVTEKKRKRGV